VKHSAGDTPAAVDAHWHRLLARRSAAERIRMACAMLDDARALAAASLLPGVASNPAERSIALLIRFYGRDLDRASLDRVIDAIRRRSLTTE
jgi:hypothetical protein